MDKYLELKEKFEANRDDENAVKMAAYMRNLFSFYTKPQSAQRFDFSLFTSKCGEPHFGQYLNSSNGCIITPF